MNKDSKHGRLLSNRYQLIELVGEGAMGRVYRAEDTLLGGVTVAVKFLSQTLLNDGMRDRFEREASISAILGEKSIHVVRVKDYGVDEFNIPFYVMEFLSGKSLSDLILYQPLSLKRFATYTRHICLGLESAHQGIRFNGELCRIIHRDIKPSNITIIQDPTLGEVAKILDFGIAKLIQDGSSQTQSFMGTLAYCSPEQMEGKELDNRSDIYSLGIMMYEMLTMDMPVLPQNSSFGGWYQAHTNFKPEPFNERLNVPGELQELVFRCLAKEKEKRPQNVREILQVLESLQLSKQRPSIEVSDNVSETTHNTKTYTPDTKTYTPTEDTVATNLSVTQVCLETGWPQDKPLSKIVFARLIDTYLGETPVLSVMLDPEELMHLTSGIRYNQFLFLDRPHPMLLWITLLYHPEQGSRWLPCYLDLKSHKGQQICRALSTIGEYKILFYVLNQPQQCQHITSSSINERNCSMLKKWADIGKIIPSSSNPKAAKKILKTELEKLKDNIIAKVKAAQSNNPLLLDL
ncbi:serine/threonine-protein kinase [Myxosarcina sp. GI1]|uniref:serine/threonine-protein kinase n=1 Tax=Myxosarcina sp. GI1 TaxID=1541065 RepID=UPI000568B7A0|nr:serine/threonine-protein kinase [Myxosarcina sp. GI1]